MRSNTRVWLKASAMMAMLAWVVAGFAQTASNAPAAKSASLGPDELGRVIAADKGIAAALIFGKDGKITGLGGNGKPLEQCQLCTPELEAKFGKNCLGASKPEHAKEVAALKPKLCDGAGAQQATLKGIGTVTAIHHSGTDCYTFYVCDGTGCYEYQYCY
ncbi:MAG TPA: hypothetical protein VFW00_12945 [Rhodocyclaceae bacterium]|nr:hypothetical protein [Rhodocyclaceae bacterium]